MKRLLAAVIILLIFAAGSRAVSSARSPLVLAFYYAWYDENIWKPSQVPDMPAALYVSRDPQAVARQIQQAKSAGIDAFVVSWWGAGNPTDSNLRILLDQARAANFRIAVDFEITSPFYRSREEMVASLKNLLATHAHHPAYLRVDGKPVVFFWRQQRYPVDTWRSVRDTIDPARQSIWISEGVNAAYAQVFDGHHLYSIAWSGNVAADLMKTAGRVRSIGANKIWVATVMPGNDDRKTGRKDAYVRDRRNGEFYRETWRGAFSSSPDWIIITSWNEWVEGTMIEPSVTYGDLYLNITREFAGQFKAGAGVPAGARAAAPNPGPTRTALPTRTATATATLIPGGVRAEAIDILRVRAEPNANAAILGRLREGAQITLLGYSEDSAWWQIAYPDAKKRGWVSAEYVMPAGEVNGLPVIYAPRTATPDAATAGASVTPLPTVWWDPEIDETTLGNSDDFSGARDETNRPTPTPTATPTNDIPWIKRLLPFLP